ncbi:MAG: DUF4231 domain-containing protein [Anaerolineae bacterium]|nr:DUF4231 domain-containing protein [Anaerolineae bacterium]
MAYLADPRRSPVNLRQEDEGVVNAWRRCVNYDKTAMHAKSSRTRNRVILILLTLATTVLAVLLGILPPSSTTTVVTAPTLSAEATAEPGAEPPAVEQVAIQSPLDVRLVLQIILAALPIISAIFVLLASEFSPTTAWAVFRMGAEMIRREIYLYRMEAGEYANLSVEERRQRLRDNIHKASRLEKVYDTDRMDNPLIVESAQRVLVDGGIVERSDQIGDDDSKLIADISWTTWNRLQRFRDPNFFQRLRWSFLKLYLQFTRRLQRDGFNPNSDNGFQTLDIREYIELRLVPQLNWYNNRVISDYRYLRSWKIWIAVVGGLGTFFVAISTIPGSPVRLEPWVAVTSAVATGMGLYLELKMYNNTYRVYNGARRRLQDLYDEWEILLKDTWEVVEEEEKQQVPPNTLARMADRYRDYVVRVEQAMQIEREEWMTLLIQSQTALEQKLFRGESQTLAPGETAAGRGGLAYSLKNLADLAFGQLEFDRAAALYEESLRVFDKTSDSLGKIEVLEALAMLKSAAVPRNPKTADADSDRAARLFGAAQGLRQRLALPSSAADEAMVSRRLADAREHLGKESFATAEAEARDAVTSDQAAIAGVVRYALGEKTALV